MPVAPELIGPATLGVTQGITAFTTFLPKLSDVRKANPETDTDTAADVRLGEIAAVTLTIGIGVITSSLTGSPIPAYTAVFMCLILVCLYESTLRADRPLEPKSRFLTIVPEGNAS
jgi:hypothetical protein